MTLNELAGFVMLAGLGIGLASYLISAGLALRTHAEARLQEAKNASPTKHEGRSDG